MHSEEILQIILENYDGISAMLKSVNAEELIQGVAGIFEIDIEKLKEVNIGLHAKGMRDGVYQHVVEDLIRNTDKYDRVYNLLADDISREVFLNLIRYRIVPDMQFAEAACTDNLQPFDGCMEIDDDVIAAVINNKKYITDNHPGLAVCVHRVISDIWEVPLLLNIICPDYSCYLRHYGENKNPKTILYAVMKQKPDTHRDIRKVVAMAPYERPWSNVELVKDCGLIPYLMYRNHGCEVSMVGAAGGEYPYAELVKGMKLEFLKDGKVMTKVQYIVENGRNIDCLILRGCYSTNYPVALAYKTINPNGRIYVGLDANSDWMDRIIWDNADFMEFMDNCDVIATSCTAMQKFLNEKWKWRIECIPNGYFDLFQVQNKRISFEDKEPTILTVGRLGTEQKATEILLEAFALVSDRIADWKLRLVGTVESRFSDYINDFFKRNPHLKDRVIFTGAIEDRKKLQEEYNRAKIFALPSRIEGGTPNVIAEALWAGCVTAVSQFDAYEDATDRGACGKAAPIGDAAGFAQILLELCTDKELKIMSEKAAEHARLFYDMEKIVGGLYEQLCL